MRKFSIITENINDTKSKLESLFPEVSDLEPIGQGQFGQAYLGVIGNDMVVVKLTKSLPEYWLTKMAMVSNPPNVVKFHSAKVYDESKYEYGIMHDYVNRDGIPSAETWNLYTKVNNGMMNMSEALSKLNSREEKYEFELSMNFKKEIENFFGFEIDTLQQNIGYNDNKELVIFDLDGNISRPKYESFMSKHK